MKVLAILLDVILWVFMKMVRWKELSSATKEYIFFKMTKSGQSVLEIALVQNVNGHRMST